MISLCPLAQSPVPLVVWATVTVSPENSAVILSFPGVLDARNLPSRVGYTHEELEIPGVASSAE